MKHSMINRTVFVSIVLIFLISCNSYYRDGERLFNEHNYGKSKLKLLLVGPEASHYNKAQRLIYKIDSIREYNFRQDAIRDSVAQVRYESQQDSIRELERLERIRLLQTDIYDHIENLKNISQLNNNSTNKMLLKIGLFASIANRCKAGIESDISELNRSAKECENLLRKTQLTEYPIMRKRYAQELASEFVDYDIYVKCEGIKNQTLVMMGDYFVYKYRVEEVHDRLKEKYQEFRFDAVSYRWSGNYSDSQRIGVRSKDDDWLGRPY